MKAPGRLFVEVCEDGIFAFIKPPFEESIEYIRADLVSCPKESDDLEEKAEEYAKQYARESIPEDADGEIWKVGDVMIENQISFEDGFIAGAEWQTRKMMEEAVEAEVADLNGELYNRCVECGLTDLDKVKIIIVKEDKQ